MMDRAAEPANAQARLEQALGIMGELARNLDRAQVLKIFFGQPDKCQFGVASLAQIVPVEPANGVAWGGGPCVPTVTTDSHPANATPPGISSPTADAGPRTASTSCATVARGQVPRKAATYPKIVWLWCQC